MLLVGIPANSIRSLREISQAYYAFQWRWTSFPAGDGTIGRGEDCSGLERPLTRFDLEKSREQKKRYLANCASWRRHPQSLLR